MLDENDVPGRSDVIFDFYDRDEAVPEAVAAAVVLCDRLVTIIVPKLDLEDDGPEGVQLIQLSSVVGGPGGAAYALLGLAYHARQPSETEGEINPKTPSLLWSELAKLDRLPRSAWASPVASWRELAVRRVEILVRRDVSRQVESMRERYVDAVRTSDLIEVYEPAEPYLQTVRAGLPVLEAAYETLSEFVPIVEHEGERAILEEDLELFSHLVDHGRRVLRAPRR